MPATESESGSPQPERISLCILGLGYIGLPTAALFASAGVRVHGVDVDRNVVARIGRGEAHMEPGLDQVVAASVASGKLTVSSAPVASEAFILAVPTPFKGRNEPDLSFVEAAARTIAPMLQSGNLVVLESTSPVGTTERLARLLAEMRPDLSVAGASPRADAGEPVWLAHCPERVLPGNILNELVHNSRVVGGIDRSSAERAKELYGAVCRGKLHLTSAATAELTKLAENAFRDVNIAFANELSAICGRLRIDVWELIGLANLHPRVNILSPGPGVGGHCIAVDPWFIIHSAPEESRIIALARHINDERPHWVVDRLRQAADGKPAPVIACLGLTYKADTDDLRESPALEVVELAAAAKLGTILVADPHVEALPPRLEGAVRLVATEHAVQRADIVALLVDHREFKTVPASVLRHKTVIDTRGLWR